ncbi:MAG: type III-A CRISPR-associated RAMP protein Csm5 [Chloroflexota bacterium]|nr:type III-A CRISPR-associated RAMP protein Csm5 [Chloroflexota bacterium]
MSAELHTDYRLTIETLSPVHIGSGARPLLRDYDFLVERNRAIVLDVNRLLAQLSDEGLDQAAEDPRLDRMLPAEGVEGWKAYELDIASGDPQRIRQHTKDASLGFYIPGSAVKGALRTAFTWYAHHGALTLGGLGERNNPGKAGDSVEAALLDHDPRNLQRDLLRALRVTDAYPQGEVRARAVAVDVFSLHGQPPSLRPKGQPTYVEAIPRGVVLEATLTLDRYVLRPERRVRGLHHSRKRHFFDQMVDRCREFIGVLINLDLDFYGDCGIWKLQAFYETLVKRQASLQPGEFLMPIGWGTGMLSKTIATKLTSGELSTIAETYDLERWQSPVFPGIFPKTRRLVGDTLARESLGWVKMRMEGLGVG